MSSRVAGHYQLVREIGSGGMGRVFQAVDTETGRTVAAKLLIASGEADLRSLLRFQTEGTVLRALRHPNIVQVYGTYLDDQVSCIIMELIEGRSLAQILRGERLPLARIKHLTRQVAMALAFAHSRGIIHRDVKPGNIMVGPNDHVTVTDFGVASVMLEGTAFLSRSMEALGTPLYMSPEQIEGQQVDGRTDVYALGVVLYEMVTGRPPFEGADPLSVAFKHVHKAPQPPTTVNAGLPQDWEGVILKALEKDPAMRYQSAHDLEAAISTLSDETQSVWMRPQAAPMPVTHVADPTPSEPWGNSAASAGQAPAPVYASQPSPAWMHHPAARVPTRQAPMPDPAAAVATPLAGARTGGNRYAMAAAAFATVLAVGGGLFFGIQRVGFASSAKAHGTTTHRVRSTPIPVSRTLPVYAAARGSLYQHATGTIDEHYTRVSLRDFDVRARFANPYSASSHSFDYGFEFRSTGHNRQYRLVVTSTGDWYLFYGAGSSYLAHGKTANLRTAAGQRNELRLVVNGTYGLLYVNGAYAGTFDLSSHQVSGDLAIATGIVGGDEVKGSITRYTGFSIRRLSAAYSLAGGSLRQDAAQTVKHLDAGVNVRDFIATARFENPADAATHSWDYGIEFRDTGGNNQYRIELTSNGRWYLYYGAGTMLADGSVSSLNIAAYAYNEVRLVVVRGSADLFVNGKHIATLNVSMDLLSGGVDVATGFFRGDQDAGRTVPFTNFTVWSLT